MENQEYINYLFAKYLDGQYTHEDLDALLHYFGIDEEGENLKELIGYEMGRPLDTDAYRTQIAQVDGFVRKSLKRKIRRTPKRIRNIWIASGVVATTLLAATVSVWIFFGGQLLHQQTIAAASLDTLDIPPGINRAMLVLDDGRSIVLSEDQTGVATEQDGITYADGTSIVQAKKMQYVTISTPRAGQYQVTLPDGSKVWLNAESVLRYPTAFTGDKREVEVTGEAFFEIVTDASHPFVVRSQEQELMVLGTSFNVKAYQNEQTITTTLVTGSVQLATSSGGSVATLTPGQQATLRDNDDIEVKQVDVMEAISWKDGIYLLSNSDLVELLQQLERWYDVEVTVWPRSETRLSAIIPRDAKLSEVLQAIELKTGLKFNVEGRRVITIE